MNPVHDMPQRGSAAPPGALYTSLHLLRESEDSTPFGQRKSRFGGAFGSSLLTHAFFVLVCYVALTLPRPPPVSGPERLLTGRELIWVDMAGPGGGGGGGGNRSSDPARKLETPGLDKLAVPVQKPLPPAVPKEITPKPQDPPPLAVSLPVRPMESGQLALPGAFNGSIAAPPMSQGSGTGDGAGTGRGTGSGPGEGSGLGAGSGGGVGGGAYQIGNGVLPPQLIHEVKPDYTLEAMRAKIFGEVWVSAVVLVDGTVASPRVTKSLDNVFGLDEQALKAVRQWRFRPGTRLGQPVPVHVSIAVAFMLR
jgi:protein TonB